MKCEYGCGREARYIQSNGKFCCEKFYTSCPEIRKKNSNGLKNNERNYELQYQNLSDDAKSKMNWRKGIYDKTLNEVFCNHSKFSTEYLRKRILVEKLLPYKCECGLTNEWNGKELVLELDHIDGDRTNNNLSNLRFLCPNCHSQTDTFRGRNINSGKIRVTDNRLKRALENNKSIRQALLEVGLAPKGANYIRAKKLIENGYE